MFDLNTQNKFTETLVKIYKAALFNIERTEGLPTVYKYKFL